MLSTCVSPWATKAKLVLEDVVDRGHLVLEAQWYPSRSYGRRVRLFGMQSSSQISGFGRDTFQSSRYRNLGFRSLRVAGQPHLPGVVVGGVVHGDHVGHAPVHLRQIWSIGCVGAGARMSSAGQGTLRFHLPLTRLDIVQSWSTKAPRVPVGLRRLVHGGVPRALCALNTLSHALTLGLCNTVAPRMPQKHLCKSHPRLTTHTAFGGFRRHITRTWPFLGKCAHTCHTVSRQSHVI